MVETAAMALRLENLSFAIGAFRMESLSLNVQAGAYFVLTGPNGAGKTILLELIAGLKEPLTGTLHLGDRNLLDCPPWHRRIGYVPQRQALFPFRTVQDNIGFGLEVRGVPLSERRRRIQELADILQIGSLLTRMPEGLSGGERQKIGLARALAIRPELLLLDEPVNAVDEENRDRVCREIKKIQRQFNVTAIHVSHDSRETACVADWVGVLREGRLTVQQMPPAVEANSG